MKKNLLVVMLVSLILVTPFVFSVHAFAAENTTDQTGNTSVIDENNIQTRESDWPEYNYGNWKEVAAHPERYKKITKCGIKAVGAGGVAVLGSKGVAVSFLSMLGTFGLGAAWEFPSCMID